jgi:pimeloyl-ACP methyl ester carboxylesterase
MSITVPVPDGRTLEVVDAGPDGAFPLVFHSGTPSGAVELPFLEPLVRERGLRLIAYSRPGYGGSTPRPDGATSSTVADDVADTEVTLDHLGAGDFVTIGWSGGGPRALGCAALLNDRCRAAACVAGLAPRAEIDWDLREGMAEENVEEFTAMMAGPEELEAYLAQQTEFFSVTGEQVAESLGGLAPAPDRAVLTGEIADALAASFRAAGQQGIVGWRDDDLTLIRPWGFALDAIRTPVSVWAGEADTMVPFRQGQWLAAHVAGARSHLLAEEGHISLMVKAERILDDLLDLAGLAGLDSRGS